jgi:hypothetical protein
MPASMSRHQWLLVAVLSANFGVVFSGNPPRTNRRFLMRSQLGAGPP